MPLLPRKLPIGTVRRGTTLYRAHTPPRGPIFFGPAPGGPPTHRFHAPDGSFRTCFIGTSEAAAFAEGVLHGPVPTQLVSSATLAARAIAEIEVTSTLRLARLYGRYLLRIGATATVTHGEDYGVSQPWAAAIYQHPDGADGILYTSRHDETTFSIALFDRAAEKIVAGASRPLSASELRTLQLLARYGLGLV
jgi:hypothetical protein